MRSDRAVIIAGAGFGILSTGCHARMKGRHARIFEMRDKPGGRCVAWPRKGYIFDGCLHNLAGTSPKPRLPRIWEELGIVRDWHPIDLEEFTRLEDADGNAVKAYTNLDDW